MLATMLLLSMSALGAANFTAGAPELVADGFQFTEGPLWTRDGVLIFSDIPPNRIYRADKTIFRENTGGANGLTLDKEGNVLACEGGNRRVVRIAKDGKVSVVTDNLGGKHYNSPNDIVMRKDGAIVFTDPPYGLPGGVDGPNDELHARGVYIILPGKEPRLIDKDYTAPNGLTLSPDQKILYVGDSEANFIRAYDLAEDGTISKARKFCDVPNPDGMKCDTKGNIWTSAKDGMRVYAPDGNLLQTIAFPQQPANCAFGGKDGKTLYATCRTALYKVAITVPGIQAGR